MREGIKFKTSALCTNYLVLKVGLTRHPAIYRHNTSLFYRIAIFKNVFFAFCDVNFIYVKVKDLQ